MQIEAATDLYSQLRNGALDIILVKREIGSTDGEFICVQKTAWVGSQATLETECDVVPLVLTPPHTMTRDIVMRALRSAGRRWSVRFESLSLAGLQPAVQAGLGVAAFGVGMIPSGTDRSAARSLPPLEPVEFALSLNPRRLSQLSRTCFADLSR